MRWWRFLGLVLFCATAAGSDVKLEVRSDGSTMVSIDPPLRSGSSSSTPEVFPALRPLSRRDIELLIDQHARQDRLDPKLVRAVIEVESDYRPYAVSYKGAMGLMQLMPETAQRYAVANPYDPDQNIDAGTGYLRWLMEEFGGDIELALAGYNAGPSAVHQFGGIPPFPETLNYVEKVMRIYLNQPGFTLDGSQRIVQGRKTYLVRDTSGQLLMTTTPPNSE